MKIEIFLKSIQDLVIRLKFYISLIVFTILVYLFPIKKIIYLSHATPVYDKITVIGKKQGVEKTGKSSYFVGGTYIAYRHSNNEITYEFFQNPFIADQWVLGNTYKTCNRIDSLDWSETIFFGLIYIGVLSFIFYAINEPERKWE